MDNLTLIHICSFFGIVFSFFWLANALFLQKNKLVSYSWATSNFIIGIGFYAHTFINSHNYLLGYYLADMCFIGSLFFIHLGITKFFKLEAPYQRLLCVTFLITQILCRFQESSLLAIFNVSIYMLYICASLNYIIYKNLNLQENKVRWFILSPIALCCALMTGRLLILLINPSLFSDNLTLNNNTDNTFNILVNLGFLSTIVFINATILGVVLSSLIIQINDLANMDTLTGAYNRRYLYQLITQYESKDRAYSILVLDIDFFKKINDSFGHDVGDKTLVEFSQLINIALQGFQNTTFFRLGGEEFAIVFQSTERHLINSLSEKIHQTLLQHSWTSGVDKNPTISIGIAIKERNSSFNDILKHSDLALYKAKASGRNQSVFAYA